MNTFYMGGNCLQITFLPANALSGKDDFPHLLITLALAGQALNAIWFGAD